MTKNLLLFALLLILCSGAIAQTSLTIEGRVIQAATAEGIKNVTIVCKFNDMEKITLSNDTGYYKFENIDTPATLIVNHYGFKPLDRKVDKEYIYLVLEENTYTLNDVVVTAGKTSQKITDVTVSMSTLKPKLIENTNSFKMDAAVENIPGVNIVFGQANIRGGSGFSYGTGSRVLMMLDDMPMLSADAADIKWDAMPVENIKQVEIVKGASSALFGSGAMGGVINIRTAEPSKVPFTKVNVFTGVYDNPSNPNYKIFKQRHYTSGINVFHSQTNKNTGITFAIYSLRDDGYRQFEEANNKRLSFGLKQKFTKVPGLQVGVYASFFSAQVGNFLFWKQADSPFIAAQNTASNMINKRYNIDPYIEYSVPKVYKIILRSRIYVTDNNNYSADKYDTVGIHTKATLAYNEFQYQKYYNNPDKHFKSTLTAGAVYTVNIIKSDSLYQDHKGYNAAAYLQVDGKMGKLNFSAGIRYEQNQIDDRKSEGLPVYRLGLNRPIAKYTFMRASYGTAYRFPSVAERYINTSTGGLVRVLPNPNVKSETGQSSEIGIKQGIKIGKWMGYADVAAFWNQYNNMVDFMYVPDPIYFLAFQTQNTAKKARITGIDASIGGEGNIKNVNVILLAGYTYIEPVYVDSIFTDSVKKIEPNYKYLHSRFRHTWKVNADIEYKAFSAGFTFKFNSYMLRVNDFLESDLIIPGSKAYRQSHNNGYSLWDFRIGYTLKKHKFSFVIKNLGNTEYIYYLGNMGAPRSFTLQYLFKI